jgi:steroid 5-alpha reductase family enzyme
MLIYVQFVGLGWALVASLFVALWLVEVRTSDASLVDAGWAASLGLLATFYAWQAPGLPLRRGLMAAVVCTWATRLALHIVSRHRKGEEDGRYQEIRRNQGEGAHRFFFFFYQAQGLLAVVLSIPFLLIAFDRSPIHAAEVAGLALIALGILGEGLADRQLSRHRSNPMNRGKTCRNGLWRISRHPNYFFEWLVWCGFALSALAAPYGALALASPVLMLIFIVKVTGIPPTEERALASRGDDYRRYQRTTSAFFPWFPKKEVSS